MTTARLICGALDYELPVLVGTEGENAIDISNLRRDTGLIALDPGYANTGACRSAITFVDGERGTLSYRGRPIEDLARDARFSEVCHLLIYGAFPDASELARFRRQLTFHAALRDDMKALLAKFPPSSHPMTVLSSMIAAIPAFYPPAPDGFDLDAMRLLAKAPTIAALFHNAGRRQPLVYPHDDRSWAANFLRAMFATPGEPFDAPPVFEEALNTLLVLHADHEQNCSTSSMRMVGSSGADLFASTSAAVGALSGPRHGGASEAVVRMLEGVAASGETAGEFVETIKRGHNAGRLMGFGHRVYKSYDPRARLLKATVARVSAELRRRDPLFDLALEIEAAALADDYFSERRLYPNVDFYSGILYRAMGIPTAMFTAMFALGRLPGWIAHWREMRSGDDDRIHRPRQLYIGSPARVAVPATRSPRPAP
jgi:citrate synthase